jgi:hypothetical protein
VPRWLDRGAELAGYPWPTGAEMACCTLLQILPRYNKVPSWRPPVEGYIEDSLNNKIEISTKIINQSSTIIQNESCSDLAACSSGTNAVSS